MNNRTARVAGVFLWVVAGCTAQGSSSTSTSGSGNPPPADAGGTPDASAPGNDGGGADGGSTDDAGAPADGGTSGPDGGGTDGGARLALGDACTADGDCASGKCLDWAVGRAPSVCVTPCDAHDDCAAGPGFFCSPAEAGAGSGWCVPGSPFHCAQCTTAADCGALSDVCNVGPQDVAAACHVDCSLSGLNACPPNYTCASTLVNGVSRMLCQPGNTPLCREAEGGACDRLNAPLPCSRGGSAGSCSGERACVNGRFAPCDAALPSCKLSCNDPDPSGCTLEFCPVATTTPEFCGNCTKRCPGLGSPNSNVACEQATTCSFSCRGENFDVDGQTSTGCESADAPPGGHTQAASRDVGSFPCGDEDSVIAVGTVTTERIVSDARKHTNPTVVGLNALTGAAPDWFRVTGTGGLLCFNNLDLTLQVQGSVQPDCYRLNVLTTAVNTGAQTDGFGTARLDLGSGSYASGSTIHFSVEKTCLTNVVETVTYTVNGHL